jgi:signal transduction histidine kinase/ligand-binding sensor domain-containing protein
MRVESLLLAGVLLGLPAPGRASSPHLGLYDTWRWTRFTTEYGLPSDSVHEVAATRAGTTWAATSGGLAWFDDYRWHRVETGLPRSIVRHLFPLGEDRVLAISAGRVFGGDRGGFREIPLGFDGGDSEVAKAFPVDDGFVILVYQEGHTRSRLYRYEDGVVHPFDPPFPVEHSDKFPQLWSVREGVLWVNTAGGLLRWQDGEWSAPLPFPHSRRVGVGQVAGNSTGDLLLVVSEPISQRGIWEWSDERGLSRRPGRQIAVNALSLGPHREAILVYASGRVEIREKGVWSRLAPLPPEMKRVLFLRHDLAGDLWVGTQNGLLHHDVAVPLWRNLDPAASELEGFILEILRTRSGDLWLGTGAGIHVHHPDGSTERIERILGTPLNEVTGLAEDDEGNVWVSSGSAFEGAFRWDGSTWRHFGSDDGLRAQRVHRIKWDREGRLWFLGMARTYGHRPGEEEPGAFVLSGDRFEPWGTAEGLPSGRVYDFEEAPDSSRWFATRGGLSRWRDGEWTHWTMDDGLKMNRVFTLTVDRDGRTWFGHQGGGLGILEDGDPRYLTTADGLPNDEVWDVVADPRGGIWISTQGGICSYREAIWACLDTTSGLSNDHTWPLLALPDELYVGTLGNGLSILDLRSGGPPPRIELQEPIVEDRSVLLRWQAYGYRGRPESSRVETRYRVDDGDWSRWGLERELRLKDVAVGIQEFQVQAKGLLGEFEESGVRARFSVPPPLYRRPLFLVPMLTLAIVVVILVAALVERRRRHEAAIRAGEQRYLEALEQRVRERTEELATVNAALQKNERELRELSRRLIRAGEEERKRLARDLHDDLNQRLAVLAMQIQRLGESPPESPGMLTTRARALWEQTTAVCDDVQRLAYQLHPSKLEELGLVPAARGFCEELAVQTGIRIRFSHGSLPDSIPPDASLCLYRVLQESLWNVARHSGAGEATVVLRRQGPWLRLEVVDQGRGFDLASLAAGGLGLLSMRERVRLMGGELDIESGPETGTRIVATVPLPS